MDINDNLKKLIETAEKDGSVRLPCIPTRGVVVFPGSQAVFEVGRRKSVFSARKALAEDGLVFLTAQYDEELERPASADQLYEIGTICSVRQLVDTAGNIMRCTVDGMARAKLTEFSTRGNGYKASVTILPNYAEEVVPENELEALKREVKDRYYEFIRAAGPMTDITPEELYPDDTALDVFETIAFSVPIAFPDKQAIHTADTLSEKLSVLGVTLAKETDIARLEAQIHETVQNAVNRNQREFYIREQINALQNELGEGEAGDMAEIEGFKKKLEAIKHIDEDSRKKIAEEIDRYTHMPAFSQESGTLRSYIDTVLTMPWDELSAETADVKRAEKILDEDHYGLEKVKQRVLENIAVRQLSPEVKGQIICLYGPPGVGKTSVAKSIARALDRKYVRVALGGVRDESEIRGHRKTYVGSMPGRIVAALRQVGVRNPVMLLDEIDKISRDFRGDPSSALLEVLDSEQNVSFRDHYTEVAFDLSDVLFITTANSLDTIDPPLLDRMEIIELSSYTREEKFNIAKKHLIPKQLKKFGLKASQVKINDTAIYAMIDSYTREAGVRKLEQQIAALCRKSARRLVEGEEKIAIKSGNIDSFLGHKKHTDDYYIKTPSVGCVNGLAWTSVGGVIMPLEVLVLDGKGKIQLTGSLGDVMKESAQLAVSNARQLADKYGIDKSFYENKDIHIHAPEGATPKDGPSAGVTMLTALISALSGINVRPDVAMTGEITLTGRVLPIGGLREKTMAAYKAGMKTVVIPHANEGDLDDVEPIVKQNVEFRLADTIEDVLKVALITEPEKSAPADSTPENEQPAVRRRRGRPPKNAPVLQPTAETVTEAGSI